ncbi:type II toxin-antitoxin system antitoxin SocA domain-containing protein [Bacillus cereus group sp. BfR-BA-01400]|uniref:Panacea domain-containing protein n=1 Tax=Bacillus cereus group sp. BfR-BA-01400 TaxID=2920334 RepID=UPI001F5AFFB5
MATVRQVANFFLNLSEENTEWAVTHLKLQKLVYYAQAWFVTLYPNEEPLFNEQIEAWVHGPVCRELYNQHRAAGYRTLFLGEDEEVPVFEREEELRAVAAVWETYGNKDGKYLEALTHNEDPWLQARGDLRDYDHATNIIPIETMRDYYGQRL